MSSGQVDSKVRTTLISISALILIGSILMWYMYQFRRVVICTDSLWNHAYLQSDHRETQLKINLWNRFFIPDKRVFPLDDSPRKELEALFGVRGRALFFFSPYLSALVQPQQLLQAHPKSRYVLWESALAESDENHGAGYPAASGSSARIFLLYIDLVRLADAFSAALEPLLVPVPSEVHRVRFYYHGGGSFSGREIRELQAEIEARLRNVRLQPVDLSDASAADLQISSEDIALVAGGETAELQQLLTRIENRGARAVVYGDAALRGWPTGVAAEISIDLKATLLDLIEMADGKPATAERKDRNSPESAAVQRFAVRLSITR